MSRICQGAKRLLMPQHNTMLQQRAATARFGFQCHRRVRSVAFASVATNAEYTNLARTVSEMVQTAAEASARAIMDGKKRQMITFLNPINEKSFNFMSIEPVDYPCSNMKEFETICTVTKSFLQELLGDDVDLKLKRIDEGGIDGDLCAIINGNGKQAVAVVWPTAEKLKQLKQLAQDPQIQQLYIINPQWRLEGNLVSEFGIGPWRKANEEFVATFEPAFLLKEQRIGAPSSINMASGTRYATGGVVRVQRCYPQLHVAYAMAANGASQAIAQVPQPPSYQELEGLLSKGRQAGLEIFKVAVAASALSLENGTATSSASSGGGSSGSGEQELVEGQVFYTAEQVAAMEPARLKRLLISLGLPSSGTLQKLQQRARAISSAVHQDGLSLELAVEVTKKLR